MSYKLIEDYGIIGDLHTVALVGIDGSIDWCCLPHFDSPSVFAAILDDEKGGYFKISAVSPERCKQLYLPDTNVLITRFFTADGIAELIDFMPIEGAQPALHAAELSSDHSAGQHRSGAGALPLGVLSCLQLRPRQARDSFVSSRHRVCQSLCLRRIGLAGAAYHRRHRCGCGVFSSPRQYGNFFSPSSRSGKRGKSAYSRENGRYGVSRDH